MRRQTSSESVHSPGRSLFLTAIILSFLSPAARSQENARTSLKPTVDGNAVLTRRGLTRVGNLYLLKDEIDAKDAIKEGEDALKRIEALGETRRQTLTQTQERLASIDADLSAAKQQRNQLNFQKQQLNNQYLATQDADSQTFIRNQMQQIDNQVRDKQDSIDRLSQSSTQAQAQFQSQQASLRELESEYQAKRSAYERSFQHVKAKYQPMMKDREVIESLKQLNRSARPWVMIGPQWEYERNVRSLAQLVLKETGLEMSQKTVLKRVGHRATRVKVAQLHLPKQEKDARAAGYQAWMLSTKLKGVDGAANRQKLAAALPPLKKHIAEVQKAYTDLNLDPLIASAVEQLLPGGKIEPTDEFNISAKRVPDLEKALSTRP